MMRMHKPRKAAVSVFERAFSNYRPPEKLTVSQWAEKRRVLSRESSAEAGKWRNDRTPYMVEPMDAFNDPNVHDITVVAMSQTGKSELELNIIGSVIDNDPQSILYIQPNIEEAKKFSKMRVAPMIRDCKTLREKVAEVKSRDGSNTTLQKSFPGGILTMVGSQTPSALASMPVPIVVGDEIDRFARSAGSEGDPWELAEKRTTTYFNAKRVAVSTPTNEGDSRIADLFDDGTQERWRTRCPDCGEWSEVLFDDIKFDFDAVKRKKKINYRVKNVFWACPACGCRHTERETRSYPSKWIADNPEALARGKRSFWVNAFFSPWRSWSEIVTKFLEVRKDPQKLKVFWNTILGQLWKERGDLADEDAMMARREDYGTREDGTPVELPDGVLVLTCGVDTQDDRLEYEVCGWGHYYESWGIKKGIIHGDPNEEEVWNRLDDVVSHVYKFADGRGLRISRTFVDSGGHKTQSVYRHCLARTGRQVFAIKGSSVPDAPLTKKPSTVDIVVGGKAVAKTWLYTIGVNAAKAELLCGMLRVPEPGPKYCHFPSRDDAGYDHAYFVGLLSEVEEQVVERGVRRTRWKVLPGHERNEPLDLRNYNYAALRSLDPDMDAVERRLKLAAQNKKPEATAPAPRIRRQRRQNSALDGGDDW